MLNKAQIDLNEYEKSKDNKKNYNQHRHEEEIRFNHDEIEKLLKNRK